jgi:hypothetical protein
MEPHRPSIDDFFGAKRWRSMDVRTKSELGKSIRVRDSRPAGVKAGGHFLRVASD